MMPVSGPGLADCSHAAGRIGLAAGELRPVDADANRARNDEKTTEEF